MANPALLPPPRRPPRQSHPHPATPRDRITLKKAHWSRLTKDLRQIYTAPTEAAAELRFGDFEAEWGDRYPAIIRLWRDAWPTFTPFLVFPAEIRKVVYTTNAIESLNARFRQATRGRGHFPTEQAALKVLYLVIRQPLKGRPNVSGETPGWKAALNALSLYYGDRITLTESRSSPHPRTFRLCRSVFRQSRLPQPDDASAQV